MDIPIISLNFVSIDEENVWNENDDMKKTAWENRKILKFNTKAALALTKLDPNQIKAVKVSYPF